MIFLYILIDLSYNFIIRFYYYYESYNIIEEILNFRKKKFKFNDDLELFPTER